MISSGSSPSGRRKNVSVKKQKPSDYLKERQLSLAGRLAEQNPHKPKIIELMNFNEKYQRNFQVPLDEPLFRPLPSEVVLQNFEPDQSYEVTISFRNEDKFPRRLRLETLQDTVFNVRGYKDESLTSPKVAPGMEVPFIVQFNPRADEDYNCDLVCITEREKFIVPLRALGSRAILDLPDEINFGKECPVRYENSKIVLINNLGKRNAKFNISCVGSFSVKPSQGFLAPSQALQLEICFFPKRIGEHEGQMIVTYDTGETVSVKLHGEAEDFDVRLDRNNIRVDSTSITLSSASTVRIINRSDLMAKYRWKMFATDEEEQMYKKRRQQELLEEEEIEKNRLKEKEQELGESLSVTLLERRYKNLRKSTANDPLLFQDDDSFMVEPCEGVIWPNSYVDVNIIFKPNIVGVHKKTVYCEVSGRETRLPLRLKGEAFGPRARLSYDVLETEDVFIHTSHKYEVTIENTGGIDVYYSLIPINTAFSSKFKFKPSSGILSVGQSQVIKIDFQSDLLGEFSEEFLWELEGSPEPIPLVIKGHVLAPTFQLSSSKIELGVLPYGFAQCFDLDISNTSITGMEYNLRIQNDEISNDELQIQPSSSHLGSKESQKIHFKFTPMSAKIYESNICVDVLNVARELQKIYFRAESVVPKIINQTPSLEYGECFLLFPNTKTIELVNDSDYPAHFSLEKQDDSAKSVFSYIASEYQGIIEARSNKKIEMTVDVRRIGEVNFPVFIRIAGNEEFPLIVDITAVGVGPVVSNRPKELDWGKIEVLESKQMKVLLQNMSPIEAVFNCAMESTPSVFTVQPTSGKIPPLGNTTLFVAAYLDDTFQFTDTLKISIKDGTTNEIKLTARGFGTTIQLSQDIKTVDFGTKYTGDTCEMKFVAANRGRRVQYLTWLNGDSPAFATSRSASNEPQTVFTIEPSKMMLRPGGKQELTIRGQSVDPNVVKERFECAVNFERNPTKKLIYSSNVMVHYVDPALRASPPVLTFLSQQDHEHASIPVVRDLLLRNLTTLPSRFALNVTPPFSVSPENDLYDLKPEESLRIKVTFDPRILQDRHTRKEKAKMTIDFQDHPKQSFVDLVADVFFPNLKISETNVDFGFVPVNSENTFHLTMTNPSDSPVFFHWVFVSENSDLSILNQTFDITPNRGVLEPKESETVQIVFTPTKPGHISEMIACHVQSGPSYYIHLSGCASDIQYELSASKIDFGSHSFNEIVTRKLKMKNCGSVALPFTVILKDDMPGSQHLCISPVSGVIQKEEEVCFNLMFCAFLPKVEGVFYLQISDRSPVPIEFSGSGMMSNLLVQYTRPITKEYSAAAQKFTKTREKKLNMAVLQQQNPLTPSTDDASLDDSTRDMIESESIRNEVIQLVKKFNRFYRKKIFTEDSNMSGAALIAFSRSQKTKKMNDREVNKIVHEVETVHNNTFKCDFGSVAPGRPYTISFGVKNVHNHVITSEADESKLKGSCFTFEPSGNQQLTPGSTTTFTVTCKPLEAGKVSVDLPISVASGPNILLQLRADVYHPDIQVSADHYSFGDVLVGNCKVFFVKLTNNSPVSCEWSVKQENKTRSRSSRALTSAERKPPFKLEPESAILEPKKSMNVAIRFIPVTDDEYVVDLRFIFGIKYFVLRAQGRGVQVQIGCSPKQLTLGPISPYGVAEGKFTLSNPLNTTLEIFSYDFGQDNSEEGSEELKLGEQKSLEYAESSLGLSPPQKFEESSKFVIIYGPLQSGKTTQALKLASSMSVPYINLVSLIEEGLKKMESLRPGSHENETVEAKPDSLSESNASSHSTNQIDNIFNIIKTRCSESDCADGFIIDGLETQHVPSPVQMLNLIARAIGPQKKLQLLNLALDISNLREREQAKKALEKQIVADSDRYLRSITEVEYDQFSENEQKLFNTGMSRVKKRRIDDLRLRKPGKTLVEERVVTSDSKKPPAEEEHRLKSRGKSRRSTQKVPRSNTTSTKHPVTPDRDQATEKTDKKVQSKKSGVEKIEDDFDSARGEALQEEVDGSQHLTDPLQASFETYQSNIEVIQSFMKDVSLYRTALANAHNAAVADKASGFDRRQNRNGKANSGFDSGTSGALQPKDPQVTIAVNEGAFVSLCDIPAAGPENTVTEALRNSVGLASEAKENDAELPGPYVEQLKNQTSIIAPIKHIKLFSLFAAKHDVDGEDQEVQSDSANASSLSLKGKTDSNGPKVRNHWTLRPKEKKEFMLRFATNHASKISCTFTFGVVGCSADFTLPVTSICKNPQMLTDFKKLFPKFRFTSEDENIAGGEYIVDSTTYNFGQLLANRPREKLTNEHKLSLPIINQSQGETFFLEPTYLDVPPNTVQHLEIWAVPKTVGKFEELLICCIKDNPQPFLLKIKCIAVNPAVEVDQKAVYFDRVLLNRADTKQLKLKNVNAIPSGWKLSGLETGGDEFSVIPSEGVLAGKSETTVTIKFCSARPIAARRSLKLEVFEPEKSLPPTMTENVTLSAESYDVAIDIHFPKGGDNGLDFGTLKVHEESRQICVLRNKGKFDAAYRFELDQTSWSQSLSISPAHGVLVSGDKAFTVQMIFKCDSEMTCTNSSALKCFVLEPLTAEVIGCVPIKVNFKSVYSKFAIQPNNDLNFGPLLLGSKTTRTFVIENTGEFDFTYNLLKYEMPDKEGQLRGHSRSSKKEDSSATRRRDQANTLNLDPFTVFPISSVVSAGSKQSITVDFMADSVARYEEYLEIEFSDRPANNRSVIYRIAGECLVPGINTMQKIGVFEEIGVVKSLASYHGFSPVFAEEDDVFTFCAVLTGQQTQARFKISNPFKVPCDVSFSAKLKNRAAPKPGEVVEMPFDVEPKKLQIPANDFRYVTCTFNPSSIQSYVGQFEATVESALSDPKYKTLSFELRGEGTLPRISVEKPLSRNKLGLPLLKFKRILMGQSMCLPIVLKNDGVIPAIVKLEWATRDGNEFQFKASDGVVHIKPQETQEIEVEFEPSSIKKFESEIKLQVVDNNFEDTAIQLVGESHQDEISFDDLPNDSDDQIVFGECVVGETKQITFKAVNNTNDTIRLAWNTVNDVSFKPQISHIKPHGTAEFTAIFTGKAPADIQQMKIACKVAKIRYPFSFDERKPRTPRKDEDPVHEVIAACADQFIYISATVDYASYECEQKEIIFKRTLMYQSRVFQITLKNTGRVKWNYNFLFYDVEGIPVPADESAETMPFTVAPLQGSINAGDSAHVTVRFSPIDADEYQYTLMGTINGLQSSAKQLSIPIAGSSVRPLCHFDIPDSTYITVRRNPEFFPEIGHRLTPNTRVIEFNCVGIMNRFVKKFALVNPSSLNYSFNWECLIQDSETPAFKCLTPSGTVTSGKKLEICFEFVSTTSKTVESLWNFTIPSQNVNVQFLLVGTVTEPNLYFDKTSLNFKTVLIGHRSKETIYLVNTESTPFNFNFELHADPDEEANVLQINPSSGSVPADGRIAINLVFSPILERILNRTLMCQIRRKSLPLPIQVKGEGYKIHERILGEKSDGSTFELVPGNNVENMLDYGHLMVNEKKSKRVLLHNLGKFPYEYTWSIQGSQGDMVAVDSITGTVGKGESKTCELVFSPFKKTLLKDVIAVCQITNGNTYRFRFSGVGRSPRVQLSTETCNFGSVFIHLPGTDPEEFIVQIVNKDSRDLLLDLINPDTTHGVFSVSLGKTVLAPGASTELRAQFLPKEACVYQEAVAIEVNGLSKIYVKLVGEGVRFNVETVQPELRYVNFGAVPVGEKAVQIVKLINQSILPAHFFVGPRETVEKLKTRGIFVHANEEYHLAPKATASIDIRFTPTAKQFQFSETLQVISRCGAVSLLTISGSSPSKEVKLETDSLNFGAVVLHSTLTKTVQLMNVGDTAARFHFNPSQFFPDFDIIPHEGFLPPGSAIPLEITCNPQKVSSNIHYPRLKCDVEGMPPLYLTLSAICNPIPAPTEILKFHTPVRDTEKKSISITNRSSVAWHVRPIFDSELWKGQDLLEVESGQTKQYEVFYRPMKTAKEDSKNEGTLYLPFQDGTGISYKLIGTTGDPNPEAVVAKDIPCKVKHVEILRVKNWLAKPQRFKVNIEVLRGDVGTTATGNDFIDVPGNQFKEYRLTVYAFKESNCQLKVTFTNESTKEYLFFNLNYKTTTPPALDNLLITTQVRQAVMKTIDIENPLPTQVTFTATCNHPEVFVPHSLTIPAKSIGQVEVEFLPLFSKESTARLSITSTELGTYHYDLRLQASHAAQERSAHFRTALGSSMSQSIRLLNFSKTKAEFTCRIDHPDFNVEKTVTALAAAGNGVVGAEFNVEVQFEPSKVGDAHTSLVLSSPTAGDYFVPLFGQCSVPKPQGPIIVKIGTTSSVAFKNVFNTAAVFIFAVDNPSFAVKASETIQPKKVFQIQIQYKAAGPKAQKTGKLIVSHPSGTNWVYYLKAVENETKSK